jgi:hypothetical protein
MLRALSNGKSAATAAGAMTHFFMRPLEKRAHRQKSQAGHAALVLEMHAGERLELGK